MKPINVRTKVEAVFVLLLLCAVSVSALNFRQGTDSAGNIWAETHNDNSNYLLFKEGSTYYLKNESSGKITSDTNCSTLLNSLSDAFTTTGGGTITVRGDRSGGVSYIFNDYVDLPYDVYIEGTNTRGTIFQFANGRGLRINVGGTAGAVPVYGGVRNIRFFVDEANPFGGTALTVENVQNFRVENCIFQRFDTCINLSGYCYFNIIQGCDFISYHDYGIHLIVHDSYTPNVCWIKNNDFKGGNGTTAITRADAAIYVQNGSGGVISGNYFECGNNRVVNWIVLKKASWVITNSKFGEGCAGDTIKIESVNAGGSTSQIIIDNCRIFGSGEDCIYVDSHNSTVLQWLEVSNSELYGDGTIDCHASGNTALYIHNTVFKPNTNPSKTLIDITCGYSIIADNYFYSTYDDYLITVATTANNTTISNNIFRGGKGIDDNGDFTMITDNIGVTDPYYVTDDDLIMYLPFSEGYYTRTYDLSPYDNNGVLSGANWTDGKYGSALDFDGIDDYIATGINEFDVSEEGSIELWFNSDDIANAQALFEFSDLSATEDFFYVRIIDEGANWVINTYVKDGNTDKIQYRIKNIPLESNHWYHYVVTVDSTGHNVYINGQQGIQTIVTGSLGDPTFFADMADNCDQFELGRLHHGAANTNLFHGVIDEFKIYNRSLSLDEIRNHYARGLGSNGYILSNNFTVFDTAWHPYMKFPTNNESALLLTGQCWYDLTNHKLMVYEGAGVWKSTTFT